MELCKRRGILVIVLSALLMLAIVPLMLDDVYAGTKGVITGLKQVDATEDSVSVTWNPVDDVAYQLIYGEDKDNMPAFPEAEWSNPSDPDNPVWTITGLTAGKTYYVQMRTVDPEIVHGYFEFTYGEPSAIIAVRPAKTIDPTVILSPASFEYNGKARKPSVIVKDGDTKLDPSQYSVKFSAGRKNVGTYKVTVTMKGAYMGSAEKSFVINPKKPAISKTTPKKKAFKVSWKKVKKVSGFEVQYSTGKKFPKEASPIKKVKKPAATSCKIKKLKARKKYYVRVRTYKTINGKTYYSKWSKVKTVKTKK